MKLSEGATGLAVETSARGPVSCQSLYLIQRRKKLVSSSWLKFFSLRFRAIYALAGALIIGVLLPCVFTWWHTHGLYLGFKDVDNPAKAPELGLEPLLHLLLLAGLFCGPGALILGLILMAFQRQDAARLEDDEGNFIWRGAWAGVGLAYLNFPGYFSVFLFERGIEAAAFRTGTLFFVTGATCGAWISWQAYKESHPERGFLPRFSLRTLLLLTFGWGGLLWLFMPA